MSALEDLLHESASEIAFVCVELAGNAAGGQVVSRAELARIAELLRPREIPFVLDATRILENALWVRHSEGNGEDLWSVARDLLGFADLVTASLTKDFGVHLGGILAVNDAELHSHLQDSISTGGSGLSPREHRLLARALADRAWIEESVVQRVSQVEALWQNLRDAGVPVADFPASDLASVRGGTHCVLLDTGQLPAVADGPQPIASLLAHLFAQTGIRAGTHSAGLPKPGALGRMIRLAIPLGLEEQDLQEITSRLVDLLRASSPIPPLELVHRPPGFFGEAKAVYAPLGKPKTPTPSAEDRTRSPAFLQASSPVRRESRAPIQNETGPIAIVG